MTAGRRAGARRAAALALLVACAACGGTGQAAAPAPLPAPATTSAAPSAPEPTGGLLDSRPATLDALRDEQARRPVSVELPGQDRPAHVEARTTDPVTGGLDLPKDADTVVWWGSGAAPGDGAGSVVLAAHVSYQGQTGPFTHLAQVEPGSLVTVTSADGSTLRYRVESTRSAPKDALDRAALFRTSGPPALVMVTCGGKYDEALHSYESNIVVTASPA